MSRYTSFEQVRCRNPKFKLTQYDIATLADVTQPVVSRLEGRGDMPTTKEIADRIAAAYGINYAELALLANSMRKIHMDRLRGV